MAREITIPGGKNKGTPLGEASEADIQYWLNVKRNALAEGSSRYRDFDQDWCDAAEEELTRRGVAIEEPPAEVQTGAPAEQRQQAAPPQQQAAPPQRQTSAQPQRALATRKTDSLAIGAVGDPAAITTRLAEMAEKFHLVAPATSCDVLPEGCGVAVSLVHVDTSEDAKEVYDVSGRFGLSATTLDKIAAAAGLSWDPLRSGRLDDGRDPHYCHYRAVGTVRNFDGSERTVSGEVEIDARVGSPQIEEIIIKAKNAKDKNGKPRPRDPEPQIRELRKFILRHAEKKAKNRAIADMGIKRSYAPAELRKPFAVARLMWTGETSDPELRRTAFLARQQAMSGSMGALFGQPRALPAPTGHAAPPVGTVHDAEGYDSTGTEDY